MLPRISLFLTFMPQRQECYQIEPPPNIVFDASRSNIHFYSTPGGGLHMFKLHKVKGHRRSFQLAPQHLVSPVSTADYRGWPQTVWE
jgi:hypothetical protein